MGIEPTGDTACAPPDGFEDRGHHQVYTHFPRDFRRASTFSSDTVLVRTDQRQGPRRRAARTRQSGPVEPRLAVQPLLELSQQAADDIPTFAPPDLDISLLIDANDALRDQSRGRQLARIDLAI